LTALCASEYPSLLARLIAGAPPEPADLTTPWLLIADPIPPKAAPLPKVWVREQPLRMKSFDLDAELFGLLEDLGHRTEPSLPGDCA